MTFPVPLTLGVEEEYQIIDPETRELKAYIQQLLDHNRLQSDQIKPEFLQSQIEMGTKICHSVKEVRSELVQIRGELCQLAEKSGVRLAAAGTHPFSHWSEQVITDLDRYFEFAADMQHVIRSLLIFGMHVHVGFGDSPVQRELMIEVMNQARYFVPHILALSASSPFWMGENTGLKSYRSIVFEQLPRTGIPMRFDSWAEYERLIRILSKIGSLGNEARESGDLGDATRIWWDIRPHPKFNTLEFRICDVATTIDEAVCITAMFQTLVAKLIRLRMNNMTWRIYPTSYIAENKWRAVRYGTEGKLVDFGQQAEVPFYDLIAEMVELLSDVAEELGCLNEVEYALTIAKEGSSADRQLAIFKQQIENGATEKNALVAVVDNLVAETYKGL